MFVRNPHIHRPLAFPKCKIRNGLTVSAPFAIAMRSSWSQLLVPLAFRKYSLPKSPSSLSAITNKPSVEYTGGLDVFTGSACPGTAVSTMIGMIGAILADDRRVAKPGARHLCGVFFRVVDVLPVVPITSGDVLALDGDGGRPGSTTA